MATRIPWVALVDEAEPKRHQPQWHYRFSNDRKFYNEEVPDGDNESFNYEFEFILR